MRMYLRLTHDELTRYARTVASRRTRIAETRRSVVDRFAEVCVRRLAAIGPNIHMEPEVNYKQKQSAWNKKKMRSFCQKVLPCAKFSENNLELAYIKVFFSWTGGVVRRGLVGEGSASCQFYA